MNDQPQTASGVDKNSSGAMAVAKRRISGAMARRRPSRLVSRGDYGLGYTELSVNDGVAKWASPAFMRDNEHVRASAERDRSSPYWD